MTIDPQAQVTAFHVACGFPVPDEPTLTPTPALDQRLRLLEEELEEFRQAAEAAQSGAVPADMALAAIARELGDLLYLVYGTGTAYGLRLGPVFAAIHRANMDKGWLCPTCGGDGEHGGGEAGEEGNLLLDPPVPCDECGGRGRRMVLNEAGKPIKAPDWKPADVLALVRQQLATTGRAS